MSTHRTATSRGFILAGREWGAIGGATALMTLSVLVMYVVAVTPLAAVNDVLFAAPIVGVLVYGAAITGGELVAERGVEDGSLGLAVAGVVVLQLAFGTFGAGLISMLPRSIQFTALAITAVVTAAMTAVIGTYVYARRGTDFDHYGTWATYAFLGGIGAALVGTFLSPVLLLAFVLIFAGFLLRLGWEMWQIREDHRAPVSLQAIGLYVAVAGVFVHVLQLVVRSLARR